ncbi:MAG: hypothetical protein IPO43_19450 [Rhodoferax sp.]|nr:hypothetical protein [Rhodoferax sp.]
MPWPASDAPLLEHCQVVHDNRRSQPRSSPRTGVVTDARSVVVCLEARDACHGLEIVGSRIVKARTGNFVADFSNFRRRTETTGWRFNALILFVDDLVVYRSWGGQPKVSEVEVTHNPLGPLQDVGPSLISGR